MTFKHLITATVRRGLLPLLPARLRLAVSAHVLRLSGKVEPEILHLPRLLPPTSRRLVVDVGANSGDFGYLLARYFDRAIAIEANTDLAAKLMEQRPANMEVIHAAVSDCDGQQVTLHVPQAGQVILNGWASLVRPDLPGITGFKEFQVTTMRLDSLLLDEVSLIKVDVEGHELAVIKGAVTTLERHRPWLLVECWDQHRAAICAFLADFGYTPHTLSELCGVVGSPQNTIFIPARDLSFALSPLSKST